MSSWTLLTIITATWDIVGYVYGDERITTCTVHEDKHVFAKRRIEAESLLVGKLRTRMSILEEAPIATSG